jgi:uncharacterized protein
MNNKSNQFTLEITTTALCNLGCSYCFEGVKTNTQRLDDKVDLVKKRIYEFIESDFFINNYDNLNISFWGGEPTLNGKLIIDIMQEFQRYDYIGFHIYTNGYNRKRLDDILDNVDCSKLHIQISYDGKEINDKFRITHSGKPTSSQVVENIEYFAKKGIGLSLKSTIPLKSMTGLYKTWLDFKDLHQKLNNIGKNITVSYAPTIDYVEEIPKENLPELIESFRKEMLKIAKEEISFYEEHGRHLCTWFNGSDSKQHCASGAHMHAIDVDGKSYACHGSLYSPNKELMQGSDIQKNSFVQDVEKMAKSYQIPIRDMSDTCKGCVATTCMICPVSSLDNSKKEDYFDRWTDRWVNNMCGFFKSFGEIDRTVQKHLMQKQTEIISIKREIA